MRGLTSYWRAVVGGQCRWEEPSCTYFLRYSHRGLYIPRVSMHRLDAQNMGVFCSLSYNVAGCRMIGVNKRGLEKHNNGSANQTLGSLLATSRQLGHGGSRQRTDSYSALDDIPGL